MTTIPLSEEETIAAVDRVITFVRHRFRSAESARRWVTTGRISGHGEATPLDLICAGREEHIYEAIRAMEAGVHA